MRGCADNVCVVHDAAPALLYAVERIFHLARELAQHVITKLLMHLGQGCDGVCVCVRERERERERV